VATGYAMPTGNSITLPTGVLRCGGIACFAVFGQFGLASNVVGPFTAGATSAFLVVGDAMVSETGLSTGPPQVTGDIQMSPCFATAATGPWTAFPDPTALAVVPPQLSTSATGFFSTKTTPAVQPGTSYFFGLCGRTDIIMGAPPATTPNADVDSSKLFVQQF
jgi:hypothetical protein